MIHETGCKSAKAMISICNLNSEFMINLLVEIYTTYSKMMLDNKEIFT